MTRRIIGNLEFRQKHKVWNVRCRPGQGHPQDITATEDQYLVSTTRRDKT
ncbi:hypothetical protein TNCV_997121, partial [Trichonephila clavipes]